MKLGRSVKHKIDGCRFGKLVAIRRVRGAKCQCVCDCGTRKLVLVHSLVSKRTQSCGCYRRLATSNRLTKHGCARKDASKLSRKILYCYRNMMSRCYDSKNQDFDIYGGRGVSVNKKWREDLRVFQNDMGPPPTLKHTLERKDSNGNYEKENCCWATIAEQALNKRRTIFVTLGGITKPLITWAREKGIPPPTVYGRFHGRSKTPLFSVSQ